MTAIDALGALALVFLLVVFYSVRKIPVYVALGATITLGFAAASAGAIDSAGLSSWLVMTLGLGACTFGLLIVRVMLIRSVSLNMLRGIQLGSGDVFDENIGARVEDMQAFRLVEARDGLQSLTPFGRFAAGVVGVTYALFRLDR